MIDGLRPDRKLTPEQTLWRSVAAQAVMDLFATPRGGSLTLEVVRLDALQWLTALTGPDADARAHVCDLAGLDCNTIRNQVLAVLEGRSLDLSKTGPADQAGRLEEARDLHRRNLDRPIVRRIVSGANQLDVVGRDGPFSLSSLGALLVQGDLPIGPWRGAHIPSPSTGAGKVLFALTRPRGASLGALRKAHAKDWESQAAFLCHRFSLDLVWLNKAEPATESDPDARAYLIPRPIETSIAA